ncbi:asparaginase [Nakamurella lactea]|uniref:asparaginase n=1 Tax=Nakamurella lactea TaxID=459515 RepID=UPI00041619FE|nr:asparaginase [Nakamurella lactea]
MADEPASGAPLPLVGYIALGGTIASVPEAGRVGAAPGLSSAELAAAVPGLTTFARIETADVDRVGSSELTMEQVLTVRDTAEALVDRGAVGVVVSQGTDSLEESAYALDLLWDRPEPVVFTAAMRTAAMPGADGPANLLGAVRCAIAEPARDLGVLVCLNDEVHAARWVRKTHTSSVATFRSDPLGPLGWLVEDRLRIPLRHRRFPAVPLVADAPIPPVALVTSVLGDDGRVLAELPRLGYRGLVLAGMGGGHVPSSWLAALRGLVEQLPVVLACRTGAGEGLRNTYSRPGSEIDLLATGLVSAGALHPFKARMLLTIALAAGYDDTARRQLFAERAAG